MFRPNFGLNFSLILQRVLEERQKLDKKRGNNNSIELSSVEFESIHWFSEEEKKKIHWKCPRLNRRFQETDFGALRSTK